MAVVVASETPDGDVVYVHSRSWSAVLGDGETIVAVADAEPVELHIAPPPGLPTGAVVEIPIDGVSYYATRPAGGTPFVARVPVRTRRVHQPPPPRPPDPIFPAAIVTAGGEDEAAVREAHFESLRDAEDAWVRRTWSESAVLVAKRADGQWVRWKSYGLFSESVWARFLASKDVGRRFRR